MKRIIGLIVVAAVVVAFKASASERGDAPSSALAVAAGNVGTSGAHAASSAAQRTRFGIGRFAGRIIAPAVTGMAEKNAVEVAELQPAIGRSTAARRSRALEIDRRRVAADSLAQVMIAEGRPIAAVRQAMKARSLVDAVRHQITEELLR
jgi:hypothetical protein